MNTLSGHRRTIVNGLAWMYLSAAMQGISKLVVLALLTRLLSPRDFGLLGIALIFTSLAERLGQVGIGPALIQKSQVDGDDVVTGAVLSIGCGACMTALLWLAAPAIATFFSEPVVSNIVRALSIGFLIDGCAVTSDALLQRSLGFKRMMVVDNISYLVGMGGIGAVLAVLGFGVWALVIAHIVMRALRAVMLGVFMPTMEGRGRFNRARVRELLYLGGGFSLGRILNFASLQGDNFVVGRLLGIEALGLYSRAYQLMALPAMYVAQVFERVLFPVMAKKQQDIPALREGFLTVLELLTVVSLPTGVFFFMAADPLVAVLFGDRWGAVAPVLSILSFGVFFRTAYKCSDTVVRSLGAVYQYAYQQGLYALSIVVGSGIGAVALGLPGVSCGVVGAVAGNYLCMTRMSARLLRASGREVVEAHMLGVWCSVWLAAGLWASRGLVERHAATAPEELACLAGVSLGCAALAIGSGALFFRSRLLDAALLHIAPLVSRSWKGSNA